MRDPRRADLDGGFDVGLQTGEVRKALAVEPVAQADLHDLDIRAFHGGVGGFNDGGDRYRLDDAQRVLLPIAPAAEHGLVHARRNLRQKHPIDDAIRADAQALDIRLVHRRNLPAEQNRVLPRVQRPRTDDRHRRLLGDGVRRPCAGGDTPKLDQRDGRMIIH